MIFGYNGTHGAGYWYVPISSLVMLALWLVAVVTLIVLWMVRKKRR
jgi:hypothetical protein